MAIRHTREMSIQSPNPKGLGLLILAARWDADAGVVGSACSLTHLQVRSLACSPPPSPRRPSAPILGSAGSPAAFASAAHAADPQHQTQAGHVPPMGAD
jgi:hypothetical protein